DVPSLTHQKMQNRTLLSWHTDSELGEAVFYVERSIDGDSFQDVTFIPSKANGGTSNIRLDYSWQDTTHTGGTYIYQLKQVDLDGTQHFSNFVEVHWGVGQMIVYQNYPNPLLIGTPVTPSQGTGLD